MSFKIMLKKITVGIYSYQNLVHLSFINEYEFELRNFQLNLSLFNL